jgi:hypothetical protein
LIAPLLVDFIENAMQMDEEWANITISRLSAVIGDQRPSIWMIELQKGSTPAIAQALGYGRHILLDHITRDPREHHHHLECVPLMLKRGDQIVLMPEGSTELKAFDQILFCGQREVKFRMLPILSDINLLNYVMSLDEEPETYFWKMIQSSAQFKERRSGHRKSR